VGRESVGKTYLFSKFAGLESASNLPETKGFNNQIVTWTDFECVEIWDPSGAEEQRIFWKTIYSYVCFDHVIYVVDTQKYLNANEENLAFVAADREELHALLSDPLLRDVDITLYLNSKEDAGKGPGLVHQISDALELFRFLKQSPPEVATEPEQEEAKSNVDSKSIPMRPRARAKTKAKRKKEKQAVAVIESFERLLDHLGLSLDRNIKQAPGSKQQKPPKQTMTLKQQPKATSSNTAPSSSRWNLLPFMKT